MAGQLKVDSINADSNLSLRIANTAVAFIDSNGLRPTSGSVSLDSTGTTGIRLPSANTLAFFEGGAEAMRIDSSGRLGIGTTSPSTPLEIKSPQFTDSEITLDNTSSNTTSRVLFKAAGTEYGRVSGDSTQVTLQAGNIPMVFRTNSAERMRIDSSGNLLVGITSARSNAGDVQVSKGISFPATQSAQSDANTLDDYEEGTWTPTFNANLTAAAAYAKGRYVKIGSMVWVTYAFRVGTVSGGNDVEFGGLPFANIANTADTSSDTFLFTAYSGGPTVGDRGAGGYISSNSSTIIMYDLNNNANVTAMTNGDLTADDFIWVSGWYRTS